MPAKKTPELPNLLVDIPCVYLLDRSGWQDFKRALNDCGLTWNLPDWMTTIVYQGREWNEIKDRGTDLKEHFPEPTAVLQPLLADENKDAGPRPNLVNLLNLPLSVIEKRISSTLFCNLSKIEFESDKRLPARQKFWNWMVRCLRGSQTVPAAFHYLVDEVDPYDISYLFKRLCQVLDQVTICSLDDELETVIKLDYKPQTQNIFSYYADLRKAVKQLHDSNECLPEAARIVLPDAFLRSRLVRAARQVPVFKPSLIVFS